MNKQQTILLALVLSLAANLLIAGVLIGRASRPAPEPPMAWAAQELTPQLRSEVRQRLKERAPRVRPLRAQMRDAMQAVRRLAAEDEFDPQAMRQALARLREAEAAYQAFMHEEVLNLAASVDREARLSILGRALHPGGRPPRGGDGGKPPGKASPLPEER